MSASSWQRRSGMVLAAVVLFCSWCVERGWWTTLRRDLALLDAIVPDKPREVPLSHLGEFRVALGLVPAEREPDSNPVSSLFPDVDPSQSFVTAVFRIISDDNPDLSVARGLHDRFTERRVTALWSGRLNWRIGRKVDAVTNWREALPDSFPARARLAEALYISGELDLAFAELAQVFYLSSVTPSQLRRSTTLLRHWALWSGSRQLQACAAFLRTTDDGNLAHTRVPEAGDVWALQAIAHLQRGNLDLASASLAHIPAGYESSFVSAVHAARAWFSGHRSEALALARTAIAHHNDDGHALIAAAEILGFLGMTSEQADALQIVVDRVPELEYEARALLKASMRLPQPK